MMFGSKQLGRRRRGTTRSAGRCAAAGLCHRDSRGGCLMTAPLDVAERRAHYRDGLRAASTNPMVMITPATDEAVERSVLVAQDDSNCRRALQHYLQRLGYHVTEAANAPSLEAAFDDPTDLVILDFDLGGGTSEVLTKIRHRSTVPVVVCSGSGLGARAGRAPQSRCRRHHHEAVLLRRARGPDAGRPSPRQRRADDHARSR